MAAPVDTSEGGEAHGDSTEETVDYEAMLTATLERHKVKHIADIVAEVEELSLSDLLKIANHQGVVEVLTDIHEDEDNGHTIKMAHRLKFAKAVMAVADQRKEALNEQLVVAASPENQVKLLFLGKEEEEAIEAIQSGHKAMAEAVSNVKRLFNVLDGNNESAKAQLLATGEALAQRIDEKVKAVGAVVDGVYQFHLGALKQRDEVTRQSAKVVAKVLCSFCLCVV